MSLESSGNAKDVFLAAIEIECAEDRNAYLDRACDGDTQLRERVSALILAHEAPESLLNAAAPQLSEAPVPEPTHDFSVVESLGAQIGPYKLRERLGAGGMGVVWAAEQKHPLRRKVALKVIKPGMDSEQVLARFEAEREALSLMDHPNIARVLDAGTTPQGRPFFVMELIRGVPITEYCDAKKLTIRARLALFVQACRAVQHAHQKGVIHRDIKPSNVLVGEQDGHPVLKVIDFGVAKALHSPQAKHSVYTGLFQAIGTLAYMSPEQAGLSISDIDTRADIYGLGVLLYELLTGSTPFDKSKLESAAWEEACRIIREEDPLLPSTRISSIRENLGLLSSARSTDNAGLTRAVRGDLDWIVMTAMDKDRGRRYETANSLAADLQRFLDDQPVHARPPSNAYRLRKFIKRNRRLVVTSLFAGLALSLGFGGVCLGLYHAMSSKAQLEKSVAEKNGIMMDLSEAISEKEKARQAAEKRANENQRLLYGQDMNVAFEAWNECNRNQVESLLLRHLPTSKLDDLRRFEWYHLAGQVYRNEEISIPLATVPKVVFFLEDGHQLLAAHTFDLITRTDLRSLRTDVIRQQGWVENWFVRAALSPNRELLAYSAAGTQQTWLRDMRTDATHELSEHSAHVTAIAFSSDSSRIAVGGADGTIILWDAQSRRQLGKMDQNNSGVQSMAFHGDTLVSAGQNRKLFVWNTRNFKLNKTIPEHAEKINCLSFSPEGAELVVGDEAGTAVIWNAKDWVPLETIREHDDGIRCVAYSNDGLRFATGSRDNTIKIWDSKSRQPVQTLRVHSGILNSLAFSPDDKKLASAGQDYKIAVTELDTNEKVSSVPLESGIADVKYFSPLKCVIVLSFKGTVQTLDAYTGEEIKSRFEFPGNVEAIATSEQGDLAFATNAQVKVHLASGRIITIDLPDDRIDFLSRHTGGNPLALSADGRSLALGTAEGRLLWWDLGNEITLHSRDSHNCEIQAVAFSSSGLQIAAGGFHPDSRVVIWDARTGEKVKELPRHRDTVLSVAFSPNDEYFATGSFDNYIRLWELPVNKDPTILRGHSASVHDIAFSSDGVTLVSAGGDRTVRVWDVKSLQQRGVFRGYRSAASCLDWVEDESALVTGGWDGTVRFWRRISEPDLAQWIKSAKKARGAHPQR